MYINFKKQYGTRIEQRNQWNMKNPEIDPNIYDNLDLIKGNIKKQWRINCCF